MNIITCATLLAVNHPSVAADKRSILFVYIYLLLSFIVIIYLGPYLQPVLDF